MMSIEQDKDNSPGKGVGVGLKKERFFMRVKMCDKNKIKNKNAPYPHGPKVLMMQSFYIC